MPSNSAEYQRDYRRRNPDYQTRQKALEKAREEARRFIAERYLQEYLQVLKEIKLREGL
jgi:molecular chaperone GrpE (heat shock protein)